MLGKGKFKAATDLYDYLVHGTTGVSPFEVITEKEFGSIMERLEWIKNSLRRGTGPIVSPNLSLWGYLVAHHGSVLEDFANLFWYLENMRNTESIIKFPSAEALDAIAVTAATDTTEKTITVSLPSGASIVRVMLAAFITAMNNTANAQKIDIDVKGRKGIGGWSTFFSQDDVIGFPAADGATTGTVPLQDVTALVDATASYGFKCTITQSSANSVRYTTQYVLIVTYKMS